MSEGVEKIGRKDVLWNFGSTILLVGAGVILLPFMLRKLPAETIGLWQVFQTINALVLLLDFGFRPSFARNVSYIFSGVQYLQSEGVTDTSIHEHGINYGLLRINIDAMRRFYRTVAILVLVLLGTLGSLYFYYITQKYTGDMRDAWVGWILLVLINSYNLYTLYYDALLLGKGYIKQNQQIIILSQTIYLLVAVALIYVGLGLSAIVAAQALAVIIRRILSKRLFFTKNIRETLRCADPALQSTQDILKVIFPNAFKIGLTYIGGFIVSKSALLIGSAYLPLEQIAMYGTSLQVLDVMARCGMAYYTSYIPKLAQFRAERNIPQLRITYRNSILLLVVTYLVGSILFIRFGDWAMNIIGSETKFLPTALLSTAIVISFLEHNHSIAAGFIMADNRIPFWIPSLLSGAVTILLLWLFLSQLGWGLWGMVLAGGFAQLAYQNWKWPSVVIKELARN